MSPAARFALVSMSVYAASLAVVTGVSWVTGPAFFELPRVTAVTEAERVILKLAVQGPGALVSSAATSVYDGAREHGAGATLLGAWFSAAARHGGWFDVLTAQRAPWLLVTACLPLAAFWTVERTFGRWVGLLAVALLLVQPGLLHEAAVASTDAVVCALELLVFACYLRSVRVDHTSSPAGRLGWAAATAAALGVSVASHLATLWVVPAVLVHFAFLRRRELRRAVGHGRLPMPAAVLFALVVTPLTFVGCAPHTWRAGVPKLVAWMLGPLGASSGDFLYRGVAVTDPPFPVVEPFHWLVAKTPLLVLVLAFVGLGVWARRVLGEGEKPDPNGLGFAAALFFVGALVAPWALPPLLASFPARVVAAGVFLTVTAALGLDSVARRLLPERRARLAASALVAACALPCFYDLPTAGGAFGFVVGGPEGVLEARTFPPSDGSEVARAVPLAPGGVESESVPKGYWAALANVGRGPKDAVPGQRGKKLRLVRGRTDGAARAITYHGTVLWSLVR